MPSLRIVLDGDGAAEGLAPEGCIRVDDFTVCALDGGMKSGHPSVGIIIELDDGQRWVLAETSLRLFLTAADVFRARYGDPRVEAKGEPS